MKNFNTSLSIPSIDGVVNILKPPGMTSSDVVSDVRRLFGIKRVGHTGTLDPGAAGVLPVCIGRATKLFDIFVDKQKEYIAEIAFGARTDTQDSYGVVTEKSDVMVSADMLLAALPTFLGKQRQIAPAYSALKVNGQALYTLARKGAEIPERIREIEIHALEYICQTAPNRFLIRVGCSRGTYVRTLCEDIGRRMGAMAHLSFLLRTASGMFCVEKSYSIMELASLKEEGRLLEAVTPVEEALGFLPKITVQDTDKLKNGRAVAYSGTLYVGALYRVYGERFLGVGAMVEDGLKLKIHF